MDDRGIDQRASFERIRYAQAWEDADAVQVDRAARTLQDICSDDATDLARLSVGLRVVRGLLATG